MAQAGFAINDDDDDDDWTPLKDFRPSDPLITHPWKNPASAHARKHTQRETDRQTDTMMPSKTISASFSVKYIVIPDSCSVGV